MKREPTCLGRPFLHRLTIKYPPRHFDILLDKGGAGEIRRSDGLHALVVRADQAVRRSRRPHLQCNVVDAAHTRGGLPVPSGPLRIPPRGFCTRRPRHSSLGDADVHLVLDAGLVDAPKWGRLRVAEPHPSRLDRVRDDDDHGLQPLHLDRVEWLVGHGLQHFSDVHRPWGPAQQPDAHQPGNMAGNPHWDLRRNDSGQRRYLLDVRPGYRTRPEGREVWLHLRGYRDGCSHNNDGHHFALELGLAVQRSDGQPGNLKPSELLQHRDTDSYYERLHDTAGQQLVGYRGDGRARVDRPRLADVGLPEPRRGEGRREPEEDDFSDRRFALAGRWIHDHLGVRAGADGPKGLPRCRRVQLRFWDSALPDRAVLHQPGLRPGRRAGGTDRTGHSGN